MNYEELSYLRDHPAWALLRADHAPLVLSFLGRVFAERNAANIPASALAAELDDELYALNQRLGEGAFPKEAARYLDDWASPVHGWLRKYYAAGSDEAHYDLSPAVEKALLWVNELRPRDFVGTESRLNTIFELLRQMVFGAEEDPERRLAQLHQRKDELDLEIRKAQAGDFTLLDAVSQRDRYQQFARTARELLSDFREVEENFRSLDRQLREKVAAWSGPKADLLEEAVGGRHGIAESDQGRSFRAFYDFLLSHQRQVELSELLERLGHIEQIRDKDDRLAHVHFDWADACERTQGTVRLLSEQLRRFLDDQVWVENRRVMDLLRAVEGKVLALRGKPVPATVSHIDDISVTIALPMERPLHKLSENTAIQDVAIEPGEGDFDDQALLGHDFVDRDELRSSVLGAMRGRGHTSLREVVAQHPLEQGLAELVSYLTLNGADINVVFDEADHEEVTWASDGAERVARLSRVSFQRPVSAP